jgi:hypothetical protein
MILLTFSHINILGWRGIRALIPWKIHKEHRPDCHPCRCLFPALAAVEQERDIELLLSAIISELEQLWNEGFK